MTGQDDATSPRDGRREYRRSVSKARMDRDAVKVIRRLRRNGHQAYLVGGGVRDLLLDIDPKDFDIATSARPSEVRNLFRNCRIIGRRFRLAHVLFSEGKIIEVATFRKDPSNALDATESAELAALGVPRPNEEVDLLIRHDNVFGEPNEDARRRDFTINGLFYDTESERVIDYVGGMEDLDRRIIRTIGLPDVRFREDPVRMLRAIKFSARLDFGIDPDVYDALVAQRTELARAAKPRLLEELLRLLRGGAAHRSFWLMWETGILSVLMPELSMHLDDGSKEARQLWARLDAVDAHKRAGVLPSDAVLFAALLLGPISEALAHRKTATKSYESLMGPIVERVALPRRLKERVRNIVACQSRLRSGALGALPRRDYFADAASLFGIDCYGRGQRRPEWLDMDFRADRPARTPRRRSRGRRGRRS